MHILAVFAGSWSFACLNRSTNQSLLLCPRPASYQNRVYLGITNRNVIWASFYKASLYQQGTEESHNQHLGTLTWLEC